MTKHVLAIFASILLSATFICAEEPAASPLVKQIKVLPDKAIDPSSLKSLVESVTRDCKTNDDKMVALNNFMRVSHYHRAYPPGSPGLLWYNNYGWSLCGGLASLQEALYSQIPGWGWRGVHVPGHNMSEAKYDGAWHWVDAFTKFYCWRSDKDAPNGRTIACHEDIKANPGLVNDNLVLDPKEGVVYAKNNRKEMIDGKLNWTAPVVLPCGDELKFCLFLPHTSLDAESTAFNPGWLGCSPAGGAADGGKEYSANVDLRPGFALENTWDGLTPDAESWPIKDKYPVGHSCGNKDLRNDPCAGPVWEPYFKRVRSFWNGRLTFAPDFSNASVMQCFEATENAKYDNGAIVPAEAGKPASVTVMMASPYLVVRGGATAEGADKIEVGGRAFGPAEMKDYSAAAKNQLRVPVKVVFSAALKSLKIEEIVMNNAGVLPYLSPGKNTVTVSVADPKALGENKLVVTYVYEPGYREKSFEDVFATGKRLFAQVSAVWADKPTVVQKTFTAKDLPAKFDIDVPTPKDKFPVYPRMLFVRREILTPSAKPQALPEGAQEPKMADGDELKTLPNPYLIGTQLPPPAAPAK